MPPKQILDFQSFVIEYERRHADLEQRFAVQSAEQKIRDEQTAKELACANQGIADIKKLLNNGLMTRVASIEETLKGVTARVNARPRIVSWEFWQPVIRDFVRVAILLGIMIALQNATKFVSAFGISVP